MKFSVTCFGITLALGLLSMGYSGQLIYYLVSPVLNLKYAHISEWHGDWVWPASIYVSLLWPLGFLIGGWVLSALAPYDWPRATLYGLYVCILLVWDLLLWLLALNLLAKGKPA